MMVGKHKWLLHKHKQLDSDDAGLILHMQMYIPSEARLKWRKTLTRDWNPHLANYKMATFSANAHLHKFKISAYITD